MVEVGGAGYISVTNTSSGTTDAAVTILGYVQDSSSSNAGETFAPLPYGGVLDTRSGYGAPQAQIPSGGSVTVQVAGTAGVPSDAVGAALYLGAANASASGWITAFATGTSDPGLRVLSYTPGQIVRNLFYGNLSSSGQITLVNHGAQPVDLMAAVQGYLVGTSASEAGDTYSDVPIQRIADTRNGTGGVPAEPVAAGGSITFSATGVDGVPASGVDAVVQTVAASNPTATGFLSVYPAGGADPGNSAVNFNSGDAQDADLTAPLVSSVSPTGEVTVTNHSSGTVDVIVSIRGYYTAPTAPPAPVLVDAGQSGTIATVTWSPPATDGGAAITSYTATLYNADGSVNSSTSTDPTADNMSFPGLSESDSYTVGVTATNAVGTSGSGTATVNVVPEGWEAPSIDELDYSSDWDIDPTTGDLTYDDGSSDTMIFSPDGTMTSDVAADPVDTSELYTGPSPAIGSYQCILNTQDGIKAHTPWHDTAHDSQRAFDFFHESYTAKNARELQGSTAPYWTFQDMICTTGGGESKGDYHLDFVGSAVTLAQTSEFEIGKKWGSGETNGNVSINLNFQVSAGPASVSASVGITPGSGTFSGDIEADGKFNHYPTLWQKYQLNRVNTFWESPSTWPWDGTRSYEGNASDVLYEWPMGTTGNLKLKTYSAAYVFYVNPG